jgi:hypothetical protein
MLGAVVFAALAFTGPTGQTDHLWASDSQPRQGARYRAITLWGDGELGCGAVIGREPVQAFVYRSPTHSVCVLVIPKGTAGEKLSLGYSVTSRVDGQISIADGSVRPKLIGPLPRAGRPYAAVDYTGAGELERTGSVGKTRVRVTYNRTDAGVACLLHIPKRTVGQWLVFGHSYSEQTPFVCDEYSHICTTSISHSDGIVRRLRIRR